MQKKRPLRAHLHTREAAKPFALDLAITLGMMGLASAFSMLIMRLGDQGNAVPLVFVLAVLLTARMTDGYLCSLIASLVSVFGVNYAFTYPYFEFNFTITGYPLTFVAMFTVSLVVGMLTERVKRQGRVQAEADREKMKASLLRSVSHDLRTPLTSIIGASSAVLENYDAFSDEIKLDLIGHVREDAQWLMRLVENILSITRVQDGQVNLSKNPEAVEEIAAEAVGKFHARYEDVKVSVSVPEELLMVPMDATLIEQVIINLMENAVQHGGAITGIILSVRREGERAVFSVEDDGRGIDRDVLPRLFEELMPLAGGDQGDGRRNMGIGLSACMSIVRAHGGDMSAQNRECGGARFCFSLPLEEE